MGSKMNKTTNRQLTEIQAPLEVIAEVLDITEGFQRQCDASSVFIDTGNLDDEDRAAMAKLLRVPAHELLADYVVLMEGRFEETPVETNVVIELEQRITAIVNETIEYAVCPKLWADLMEEHDGNINHACSDSEFLNSRTQISLDQDVDEELQSHEKSFEVTLPQGSDE